jgi:hypothetical protein
MDQIGARRRRTMRTNTFGAGIAALAFLAVGWLLGLVAQRATIEATTYGDITPPLMLLGLGLCALAGLATRLLMLGAPRIRTGALAGVGMALITLAGYGALIVAYWDRYFAAHSNEDGETWLSLMLEAWFWIGVPLAVSAGLGALGWLAGDRLAGHGAGGRSTTGRPAA